MKFTIRKSDMIDVLARIQGLTGRKSNLAITSNVLIKTESSEVSLLATDLETGFEGRYPAVVEKEGIIAINARKFYEIVRDFPSEDIIVTEIENRWIEIGNESVEYHIVGMKAEDFPDNPLLEDLDFIDVDSKALKKMIERTAIIGAPSDDKRAHINGIYFENLLIEQEKSIRMVSTDGSRLAKADFVYTNAADTAWESGVIIPKKGLNELNKFLSNEGEVQIGVKNNHFIVKHDMETIIIRLLEGEFPAYGDIVAKGDGHVLKLNRQLFLMMLKRMSILYSEDYKGVIFNFDNDKLIITATNPNIGQSKEEMLIDFKGEPIEVAFNPRYFIDTLNVIIDDSVLLHIIDSEKPCLIEAEEDKSFLSVIMPMRI